MSGSIASSLSIGSPPLAKTWGESWPPASSMMASTPTSYWQQPGQARPIEPPRPTFQSDLSARVGGVVAGLLVQALIALTGTAPRLPGSRMTDFWPAYAVIALLAAAIVAFAFGRAAIGSLPPGAAVVVILTFVVLPLVAWTFGAILEVTADGGVASEAGIGTMIANLFYALAFFGLSGTLFAWTPATVRADES